MEIFKNHEIGGLSMERCSRCGVPKFQQDHYGIFVNMLYDLYQAVRLSKESENDGDKFIFEIEMEFLLSNLVEMDFTDEL